MLENVPTVDYRNKYIVHCGLCHGYLSGNCTIIPEKKSWVCALCGNLSPLPKGYDINSGIETHSQVYDIISNNQNSLFDKNRFLKMFAISIDITDYDYCKLFIGSLKKAFSQIKDESVVIFLFSSGEDVTYYDPDRKRGFSFNDFENIQLPPFKYLPFSESKQFLFTSLDKILKISEEFNKKLDKRSSSFRNAIKMGELFLKDQGGIFIISLFGTPRDVQSSQADSNPLIIPNNQSDVADLGFSLNSSSISVHVFHRFDPSSTDNFSVVTDTISGLTCGSSFVVSNRIDKNDPVLDSRILQILTSHYFWRSLCILRCHPDIFRASYLGNCVIRKNGVCTLGAFPMSASSSMAYELSFPLNQSVFKDRKSFGLQFAIMFVNDEGQQICRIISFLVECESASNPPSSAIDCSALTCVVAKMAINKLRESDFQTMRQFITKNQPFCFESAFSSSLLFNEQALKTGRDLAASESIFVYGASVNELILYLVPSVVKRKNASWKQTHLAVMVLPDRGCEEEVKKLIFDESENDEKNEFQKFYDECISFIGWRQPVIFLCDY